MPTVLVACPPASGDGAPLAFARAVAEPLAASVELVHVRAAVSGPESLACDEADEAPGPPGARVVHASSAASGIQRLIADERPVLTVLGSAHDAPLGRTRVGSTAERVLQGAAGAVAVVPREGWERAQRAIGVGLLPTPDGRLALRFAAGLAGAAGVPLVVLAVLGRSPTPADAAALAARLATPVEPRGPAGEMLRAAIVAAARAGASAGLAVEPQVLVGDAVDALLRVSARVSVLVLGSRGYGPPGIVLAGGAARRVLAGARCPVVLVPRAQPARVPA
jgi:nucleotide-binding universal stress UspA family protein